jgi:hypothetical protein
MKKLIVMSIVNLRWAWFHINPRYLKFTMDKEVYFQDMKTGCILYNYHWEEEE